MEIKNKMFAISDSLQRVYMIGVNVECGRCIGVVSRDVCHLSLGVSGKDGTIT